MLTTLRSLRAVALVGFAILSGAALAQLPQLPLMPEFDFDRLEVNSDANGSIVVGTGEMLPPGTVRFSLAGEYQNNPLVLLDPTGQSILGSIISDRYAAHVVGAFAPFDWMEIGVDVPVILKQVGADLTSFGVGKPLPKGIGSPTANLRFGLLSQKKGAVADVALDVGVRAPVGTDGAWASDGRINLSPKLMIGRDLGFVRGGVQVGAKWLPASALNPEGTGNQLLIAGVLSAGDPKGLRGELSGRTSMTFDGKMGAVEVLAGARYPIGLMEVYVVAGPGLGDREASPGTPAWRVLSGVSFGNGLNLVGAAGDVTAPTPTTIPSTPMPVASSGDSGSTTSTGSSTTTTTTTTETTYGGNVTVGGDGTGFTIPIPAGGIVIPSAGGTATGGTTTYGTGSSSYPTDYGTGSTSYPTGGSTTYGTGSTSYPTGGSTTTYGTGSSSYPTGSSTTTSGTGSTSTGSTYTTTPSTGSSYTPPPTTTTPPPTTTTPTTTQPQQQPSTYRGTNSIGGMGGIQSWPSGMGTTSQPVSTDPNQQGTRNP